jgi:UDP:flavonoid glycosyltransferase YjiC (YdhE family)
MGKTDDPFYTDAELAQAVDAEVKFLREHQARMVVTGFTLTTYLSSRIAGVPLATDHGGTFLPPLLAHRLCPAPVNPPVPAMGRLPRGAQLNRHAARLGVEPLPNMLALMCGELTLVTDLPEVVGVPAEAAEGWRPRWPYRVRSGTTFRWTGPLFAKLDQPVPPDVEAFLQGDEHVVYVVPTSVNEELLRALVGQAQASGARVLVGATVHDIGDLADARTLIAGVLPNHLVMPRVAAAVIMGGQGSVQTAIASGVPFVGLPYHGEQELNVAVAERLGMAIRLSPRDAITPALPQALRKLLDDPAYQSAATRAAQHDEGVDGAARAALAITDYLGAQRPPDDRPDDSARH